MSVFPNRLREQRWFIQVWSEANLACFMQTIFPPSLELRPVLMDAVPIMHRCLLRLGSYPYQNDPEEFLTHDVLRTAIFLVHHVGEEICAGYLDDHKRAIIYQSMARIDQGNIQKKKQALRTNVAILIILKQWFEGQATHLLHVFLLLDQQTSTKQSLRKSFYTLYDWCW